MTLRRVGRSDTDWVDAVLDEMESSFEEASTHRHARIVRRPRVSSFPIVAAGVRCDPDSLVAFLRRATGDTQDERFGVVCLMADGAPICWHQIVHGALDRARLRPVDIFRAAIVSNAAGVVLAHARPSGRPLPMAADMDLTADFADVGRRLDIPVVDHIVLCRRGHASMRRVCPGLFPAG